MFEVSQVMHVLGFDPHAFAHFRDERKRRRVQVMPFAFPLKYECYQVNVSKIRVISQNNAAATLFSVTGDRTGYG